MAPVLVPVAIWVYTLVFAFSALWFAHYLLAALGSLRAAQRARAACAARAAAGRARRRRRRLAALLSAPA